MASEKFQFPDEKEPDVVISQQEDDEIEIEVVDDTPERDKGRRPLDREVADPTDAEIETYTRGAQDRIKELTHARHDERRAKEALQREKLELERLAQHMHDENRKLKQYVESGSQQFGEMAKQAAEAELEKARRDYKVAQEAFDTDGIIAAQEALTEAKMKIASAKNFRPAPLQQQEDVVQTPQPAQKVRPDEKTLRWQAKNQWFGADGFEEVTSFALGLHQNLVNNGMDPRSDEYFERIDARVKSKFPEVFGETEEKPQSGSSSKRPTSVVAPAARSSGAKKIQLTPTQIALAKKYGLTPQQYAVEVAKLEKQNG